LAIDGGSETAHKFGRYAEASMLARLGYVFEFIGGAFALILILLFGIVLVFTSREAVLGLVVPFVLMIAAAGLAVLIGSTLRYILAGPIPLRDILPWSTPKKAPTAGTKTDRPLSGAEESASPTWRERVQMVAARWRQNPIWPISIMLVVAIIMLNHWHLIN
jgi:hypothetical protein